MATSNAAFMVDNDSIEKNQGESYSDEEYLVLQNWFHSFRVNSFNE